MSTESWREGPEVWRVLRAYFPGSIETHSLVQDFFFGKDLLLGRHDYSVNIAGGFGASQLTSVYVTANGVALPSKRRAYPRGPDRRPILEMLMSLLPFVRILEAGASSLMRSRSRDRPDLADEAGGTGGG
jgi:hypothetical protein